MADIVQKGNLIYLHVSGKWYFFDNRIPPLGEGSMGTVYMGYLNGTHERVAIKRVKDKYANVPSIRNRAKLEANLQFSHPNLIEMRGYCELSPNNGPLFLLSNFISGTNIDTYIKTTFAKMMPNRAEKICQLFYPVLDALSYIHSKGITHMDIKPSNIIVENGRNVRLMDLGIAHIGKRIDMDGTAALMGTPKYAAPEQFDINGESSLLPQTDIYEAGVTLYELLCGCNPYTADTIEDSIKKHNSIILPYTDKIPRALVEVLRKATCVDKYGRFSSAEEFKSAIIASFAPKESFGWLIPLLFGVVTFTILILLIIMYGH